MLIYEIVKILNSNLSLIKFENEQNWKMTKILKKLSSFGIVRLFDIFNFNTIFYQSNEYLGEGRNFKRPNVEWPIFRKLKNCQC